MAGGASATCAGLERSNRIPPKTFGVSVFTRPPRISGAPEYLAIGVTSMPASVRCFAVPPVERISTPRSRSALASSTMPRLSETERIARSIAIQYDALRQVAHASAGFLPDEDLQIRHVGHRVRVADRGDPESSGAIVERRGVAARVLLGHQRREPGRSGEGAIEIASQDEAAVHAVEDGGEALQPQFEVALEIRIALKRIVCVANQSGQHAEPLHDQHHRL